MENQAYYRLITLWIMCEVMLGSLIHLLKIPASGLIVSSGAILCICLMAHQVATKGSILKATLIVAIFKMTLTPQVRPTAYIALFFQGILGEALFWNRRMYRLSCLLLATLALLESGLQRILVLTLIYGKDLWETVDSSSTIMIAYLLLHLAVGIGVGIWSGLLPKKIEEWKSLHKEYLISDVSLAPESMPKKKKRKKVGILWFLLLALYLWAPSSVLLQMLIRSALILMTLHFLVRPLATWLLNRWLQKRKAQDYTTIKMIFDLLPATQQLVITSWNLSAIEKGMKRVLLCFKIIALNYAKE